ncbi:kelch repeat-containing protein [Tropicibacter oceani]|uniref:Kelch repeat-containing protein n=1 Tax=Tropicibacter oceani TaxID=3058420 RepID=A0ABY8QGI3_9RHOB|nr:kelch repeat-containing protein [Tropicibacter oceani]WGW02907.1 kelch repeat-containing protein [Tropicibacter oceani]
MTKDSFTLKVVSQELRVKDPQNARVSIQITNATDSDLVPVLYLLIPLSLVAQNDMGLVRFAPAALNGLAQHPAPDGMARFRLGAARGVRIAAGASLTLELSQITAQTEGPQSLTLQWDLFSQASGSADVTLDVMGADATPKILSFRARETVLTNHTNKDPVRLEWETSPGATVRLLRLNDTIAPAEGKPSAPTKTQPDFRDTGYEGVGLWPYRLEVSEDGRTISRTVYVRVQAPGWNQIACAQGAPVALLHDAARALYGIFHTQNGSAIYPLDPATGDMGRQGAICPNGIVPDPHGKSPAAFFNNKIYLVGGSQIDDGVFSNAVQCYDPVAQTMTQVAQTAPWAARLGHSCTVHDNRLWVIGGVDENGNTLNDVHHTANGVDWTAATPLGQGLCLHSAHSYAGRLWLYGGVDTPFGIPQTGLWQTTDGADWRETRFFTSTDGDGTDPGFGAPFGAALTTQSSSKGAETLKVIATYQPHSADLVSGMYQLQGLGPANLIKDKDPITEQAGWAVVTDPQSLPQPFRLCAASFRSYIFVHSMLVDYPTNTLSFHIQ